MSQHNLNLTVAPSPTTSTPPASNGAGSPSVRASALSELERNAVYRRCMLALLWLFYQLYKTSARMHSWAVMAETGCFLGFGFFVAVWFDRQHQQVAFTWEGVGRLMRQVAEHNVILSEALSFVATLLGSAAFAWTLPPMEQEEESPATGVPARPWQDWIDAVMGSCCLLMLLYGLALLHHCLNLSRDTRPLERGTVYLLCVLYFTVKCVGYSAFWNPDAGVLSWTLWLLFLILSSLQWGLASIVISLEGVDYSSWRGQLVLVYLPFLASPPTSNSPHFHTR